MRTLVVLIALWWTASTDSTQRYLRSQRFNVKTYFSYSNQDTSFLYRRDKEMLIRFDSVSYVFNTDSTFNVFFRNDSLNSGRWKVLNNSKVVVGEDTNDVAITPFGVSFTTHSTVFADTALSFPASYVLQLEPLGLYTVTSGNWNDPSVWSYGIVPTSTDDVTVNATHLITIDGIQARAKKVSLTGKLIYQNNGRLQIGQ